MSRANRRRAIADRLPAALPAQPRPVAERRQRTISWRHCLIGLVVGELILFVVSNVALDLTDFWFGTAGVNNVDGGVTGVTSFVAVIAGAFLAARLARRWELYQGIVVAIGFIVVAAVFTFIQEASAVQGALASGSHSPVDLGSMDMGSLISGDLLALLGGSVGGLLARRRPNSSPSR
ncbi:MAG TPA: hypothetical protein VEK76_08210 [Candidatus Binatia bacterium]|nr:hypothetical protein [Candidatus Binatia bacterium]